MSKKTAVRSSLGLLVVMILAAAAMLLLAPTEDASAGSCLGPFTTNRWGKGTSCTAAQADLNAQAAAVCEICPWDGVCGPPPTIISQSSCYLASDGKWTIDGTIQASCYRAVPNNCP